MRIHYIKVSFKLFCLFTGQKEYNSLCRGLMLHISSFYGGSTVHNIPILSMSNKTTNRSKLKVVSLSSCSSTPMQTSFALHVWKVEHNKLQMITSFHFQLRMQLNNISHLWYPCINWLLWVANTPEVLFLGCHYFTKQAGKW